ncbi:membrane protease YdiL (CAAX protease family) [Rhizomicrobium palustre]|uniref:Membrane protease YdiL (CAAX protease family) n=1 Tax=Rhizomicrobium palustre TaxID=189966 RepID=A0A846N1K0_9PROT|nr:CPBP family intramembrane glutamic endopeptidase [Rhizomicrobium palustre]NIK89345.1 membrane protease YdiL (CAAX protease family) [Rhizomicrobium palustre]
MGSFLRKLPFPVEFAIVLGGAFGYALVSSVLAVVHPPSGPMHTELGMWRTIGVEALQFLVIGGFLRYRGWRGAKFGLDSHWSDGAWGLGLALVSYCVFYYTFRFVALIAPGLAASAAQMGHMPGHLAPALVAAMVLFSSFFEEFFITGYVVSALKEKAGLNVAINVSVAVRLAYHLYQGVLGVVLIIPVGLMFAYWYGKTGKLWPVIVAHALLNLAAFLPYIKF